MTPDEAKSLLPFVQAIADKKVVEERWRDAGYTKESDWSQWTEVCQLHPLSRWHELRIVEPEPTQEEKDREGFRAFFAEFKRAHRLYPAAEDAWRAALALERKRTSGGGR